MNKHCFNLFFCCFCTVFSYASTLGDTTNLDVFFKQNNIQASQTTDGIYYTFERIGMGQAPKTGDYVMLKYIGKMLNGYIFDQSPKEQPFIFQVGYRQVIEGWDKGITLFKIGSKGTLYLPPTLAYGSRGVGEQIPPDTPLLFEIELLKILTPKEYDDYMEALEAKEKSIFAEKSKKQFEEDKKIINDFAINHKLKAKRDDSGLSFVVTKQGKGELPQNGDKIQIHYEGYLTNDKLFDSSENKSAFEFELGKNKAIEGLEIGIRYFNKGSEGWIMIPSKMAYGAMEIKNEKMNIPANSVLIFKIEVVDIKRRS